MGGAITIHYGIIGDGHSPSRYNPKSRFQDVGDLFTDGDSFKVWGEDRKDHTLHIQHIVPEDANIQSVIIDDRERIAIRLDDHGWRLIDYVATTDTKDWAQNNDVYYLENFDIPRKRRKDAK